LLSGLSHVQPEKAAEDLHLSAGSGQGAASSAHLRLLHRALAQGARLGPRLDMAALAEANLHLLLHLPLKTYLLLVLAALSALEHAVADCQLWLAVRRFLTCFGRLLRIAETVLRADAGALLLLPRETVC